MQHLARTPSITDLAKLQGSKAKSPEEALRLLMEGNARFFNGEAHGQTLSAFERRAQIVTQTPHSVILGCSDSRVPVEIVFDQGPGDLFVVRVAGNVVETGVLGTIEFAVKHLDVKSIVVMGHEGCGAVQAAMQPAFERSNQTPCVRELLDRIAPAVAAVPDIHDAKARLREAVIRNVRYQAAQLERNEVVSSAIKMGRIALVGAFYEIGSGAVDFLDPAS